MKTIANALILLPLIACGAAQSPVASESDDVAAGGSALNASATPLTSNRRSAVVGSFNALSNQDITDALIVTPFGADAAFAQVDVSSRIKSTSFGHSTTLLVPAGTVSKPADPNMQNEFYVAYGPSTNVPARTFGPFELTAQAGDSCGGHTINPLRCADGLDCVSPDSGIADAPGTCQ